MRTATNSSYKRAYLVEEMKNPSSDYFVVPALKANDLDVVRCTFEELPSPTEISGSIVVFVRYIPIGWMRLIESQGMKSCRVIYFMDDDVLDFSASVNMPIRYRIKLFRLAAIRKKWLLKIRAELWVSTSYLYDKYSAWSPKMIPPVPYEGSEDMKRVFYHGSSSHAKEIKWLRPVIENVLNNSGDIVFEIIGGRDVARLYRSLPRVTVVHPMKWPAYTSFLSMRGRHVGLAPLLDVPFNKARSHTKFFDITISGAAGIYSSQSACADVIDDMKEGLILDMDQDIWVKEILRLADDDGLRRGIVSNAEKKCEALVDSATKENDGVV